MIIYKVTNKGNRKVYIGQTTGNLDKRMLEHICNSINGYKGYFLNALRKYKQENFIWEVIRICNSVKSLNVWEQYYILYYGSFGKDGYNLTNGGEGTSGHIVSKKTRNKLSISNLGKHNFHHSEESKRKISKNHARYNLGKSVTKKQKLKISNTLKLYYKNNPSVQAGENNPMYGISRFGKDNPNYGNKWTLERHEQMKKRMTGKNNPNYGKTFTIEHIKKLSDARKLYWKNKKENNNG